MFNLGLKSNLRVLNVTPTLMSGIYKSYNKWALAQDFNKTIMKNILLILIIAIFASSCSEKIDLKLDESQKRIVVEGMITTDTMVHKIKLTKSAAYFSNEAPPKLSGAVVTLNDGSSVYTLTENPASSGIYCTDSTFAGVVGRTYTLNINFNNETWTATSLLKYLSPIDSVSCKKLDSPFGNNNRDTTYEVDLCAQEPATPGDFYMWLVYKNGVLNTDTITKASLTDDVFYNGLYVTDFPVQFVKASIGDTITLEMYSISKEYYEFFNGLIMETMAGGNPFAGPPANVKGNITNGGIGFFQASATSRGTCIIQ